MNKKDAILTLKIMASADGGCSYCAKSLMNRFIENFGFKKEAMEIYKDCFNKEIGDIDE